MIPLIFDHRPSFLGRNSAGASLLTVPIGVDSFLGHLVGQIQSASDWSGGDIYVVPTFPTDDGYEDRIHSATASKVKVLKPDGLHSVIAKCEAQDYLLLLDGTLWPTNGFELGAVLRRHEGYRAATHMIAVGADVERARERLEVDEAGQIRRVERIYHGVTWPEVGGTRVFLSWLPARTVRGMRFHSLAELRMALVVKGVLCRDVPLNLDVANLTAEEGVLVLNESKVEWDVANHTGRRYSRRGDDVLVGEDCRIASSARLIGPLILHRGVTIESGVTIVGPSVLGAGCRVERDAIVAQSTLAPGTRISARTTVHDCVAAGQWEGTPIGDHSLEFAVGAPRGNLAPRMSESGYRGMGLRRRLHFAVKRAVDVAFSLVALIVLAPLLIAVSIWLKLDSPGPVFFVHRREQKGEKPFGCLKFRTMTVGAHQQQRELLEKNQVDGPQFKIDGDPRVTSIGHWLRGTNIDELPQLINVLLGDMSLVGPRPSPFRENQICVPWRRARLSVRPGITGLWQICRSPDRTAGDFHEWIYYDMAYVRNFSIWLDIKILVATLLTMGGRRSVPVSWLIRERPGDSVVSRASLMS